MVIVKRHLVYKRIKKQGQTIRFNSMDIDPDYRSWLDEMTGKGSHYP